MIFCWNPFGRVMTVVSAAARYIARIFPAYPMAVHGPHSRFLTDTDTDAGDVGPTFPGWRVRY